MYKTHSQLGTVWTASDEASWGANAETFWTSALSLCYSVAEYCAPVWSRSPHTGLGDVQLNSTLHLISGTLRSTPLPWLPLLAIIEPPALHRKAATDKLMEKIIAPDNWPIHSDITNPPHACLTYWKPLWQDLVCVDIRSQWKENWKSAQVVNFSPVDDPTIRKPGFNLPRQQRSLLNRFQTVQIVTSETLACVDAEGGCFERCL